jgi:Cu(I)/Ag(I) efflux system membrane fusion protein
MVEVTLGNALGDAYEVLSGLEAGEEVVTNGTFTVDATAQLKGKKSMMGSGSMSGNGAAPSMEAGIPVVNFEGNFKDRFAELIETYALLKDALVKTDAKGAVNGSKKMIEQLDRLKATAMPDAQTQGHLKQIKDKVLAISETVDIELQRKAFKPLSENMVAIASMMNNFDQPIYVQYCPMADGNKGASWLSFDNKIRNPYFGDAMLTCGSITKTIQ